MVLYGENVLQSIHHLAFAALLALLFCTPSLATESLPLGPLTLSRIQGDQTTSQAFLVLVEAYRRLGMTLIAEELPAERALQTSAAGITGGEVARIAGLETYYPDLMRVPESVGRLEIKVFSAGISFPVTGWESLRPYNFCYMHGFKAIELASMGMQRTATATIEDLVRQLQGGGCEVAVLGSQAWITVDRLNAGPLRELEPPLDVLPLYHYLHRRHENLVPLVAEELRKMRSEGAIDAILKPGDEVVMAAKMRQSFDSKQKNDRRSP
jgi:polar amino acid transport system substrate-binding protein